MISGGGLGPPSPLSQARTYLWAQLGSRKGEKRPPRPRFLPQKPLLGAAGDVATDSGASISLLPRGCGCPPASGGGVGIRNQGGRESLGEASGMSSPASALGLGHDPVYVTHAWSCKAGETSSPLHPQPLQRLGDPLLEVRPPCRENEKAEALGRQARLRAVLLTPPGVHFAAERSPGPSPTPVGTLSHFAVPRVLVPMEGNSSQGFPRKKLQAPFNNLGPEGARSRRGAT